MLQDDINRLRLDLEAKRYQLNDKQKELGEIDSLLSAVDRPAATRRRQRLSIEVRCLKERIHEIEDELARLVNRAARVNAIKGRRVVDSEPPRSRDDYPASQTDLRHFSGSGSSGRAGLREHRPGRKSKRSRDFVSCAGDSWRDAMRESKGKVSIAQLQEIADKLDGAGYKPPSVYLEGRFAMEIKGYNSHHSNATSGPLLSWSALVSNNDKDLLRGMRRLLSRCAQKVLQQLPSGN